MINLIKHFLPFSFSLIFIFSGCYMKNLDYKQNTVDSKIDKEIIKEMKKVESAKLRMEVAKDMQMNVTSQSTLDYTIASLATQMLQNNKFNTNRPVIITSFVKLNNLKKTTEFGRLVSESLINELSNRNFNVIEFRGQLGVSVNEQGEYFLSRNIKKLKNNIENTFVVVGTYSRQHGRIMLNARVIDNANGRIITSARATYEHGKRNDCIIFKDCKAPRAIKIVKE